MKTLKTSFFYSSRYNLFVTPQGTTEMEPSLTPVIYTQRATRRVPFCCCNNQFWPNSIFTKMKLKELICDQEEEDCQHCYSGPGASSKICYCCYCYSGRGVMLLFFAVVIVIQAFECFKQGCGLWLKKISRISWISFIIARIIIARKEIKFPQHVSLSYSYHTEQIAKGECKGRSSVNNNNCPAIQEGYGGSW